MSSVVIKLWLVFLISLTGTCSSYIHAAHYLTSDRAQALRDLADSITQVIREARALDSSDRANYILIRDLLKNQFEGYFKGVEQFEEKDWKYASNGSSTPPLDIETFWSKAHRVPFGFPLWIALTGGAVLLSEMYSLPHGFIPTMFLGSGIATNAFRDYGVKSLHERSVSKKLRKVFWNRLRENEIEVLTENPHKWQEQILRQLFFEKQVSEKSLRVTEKGQQDLRCSYCHGDIHNDSETISCDSCKAVYDSECASALKRCSVYGCDKDLSDRSTNSIAPDGKIGEKR